MKFVSPASGTVFAISPDATWPDMPFQTDVNGPHVWKWSIKWLTKSFEAQGTAFTADNKWNAKTVFENTGGHFSIIASSGVHTAKFEGKIVGTNPSPTLVRAYLKTEPGSEGFDLILAQETGMKHFVDEINKKIVPGTVGEPIHSGDGGYGISQLTSGKHLYEEVWNWKTNIKKGMKKYRDARNTSRNYLSKGPSWTEYQLEIETIRAYNGGSKHHYHVIDPVTHQWTRHPEILCARSKNDRAHATSTAGWDMNDPENTGKTLDQLFERDSKSIQAHPAKPPKGVHWCRPATCYAECVIARKGKA